MAKTDNVLQQVAETLKSLNEQFSTLNEHQVNIVDNYDILLQNQLKTTDNHDILIQNQKTIIKNQGIITHNQSSIIHNQAVIVRNQAYLRTFLHTQTEILALLTNRPKEEIAQEVNAFFENAQKEVATGLENAVGE